MMPEATAVPIRELARTLSTLPATGLFRPIRIGSVELDSNLLMESMPGGNRAARDEIRSFGECGLPVTEPIRREFVRFQPDRNRRLTGTSGEPRPLSFSFSEEETAESLLAWNPTILELNLEGRDDARLVRRVARSVPVPLIVKIDLGIDARSVEEAGAAAVVAHGRTRSGWCDWNAIAEIKASLSIPVIGTGDLLTPADVAAAFVHAGVDGVRIGRPCLHHPWIFRDIRAWLEGRPAPPHPSPSSRANRLLARLDALTEEFGEKKGLHFARREAGAFCAGIPGSSRFRQRIREARSGEEFRITVRKRFPRD